MTKRNKAIQSKKIWWLIIAYTVKLITSTSTYQCSFPCVSLGITRESRDLVFPANSFQWSEAKNTSSPKVGWIFSWVRNHLSAWYAKDRNCGKAHQEAYHSSFRNRSCYFDKHSSYQDEHYGNTCTKNWEIKLSLTLILSLIRGTNRSKTL